MEAFEDLPLPVTNDFRQPDAAIDRHEQGAAAQSCGTGMRGEGGIDECFPGLADLGFSPSLVEIQKLDHGGEQLSC